jgi:hypothetical protein
VEGLVMTKFIIKEDTAVYKTMYVKPAYGPNLVLALNNKDKDIIAIVDAKKYLPDGTCLIELDSDEFNRELVEKWAGDNFLQIKDYAKKCREIREAYVNKLVNLGCFDREDVRSLNTSKFRLKEKEDTAYLTRVQIQVPFVINGKRTLYKNLTESRFYYHVETDRLIEFMYSELYVYNAKMFFLTSDVKGLELLNPLKQIEVVSTEEDKHKFIENCIYTRLYKRMTKKIGIEVSLEDFQNNFDRYKMVYDMWRV